MSDGQTEESTRGGLGRARRRWTAAAVGGAVVVVAGLVLSFGSSSRRETTGRTPTTTSSPQASTTTTTELPVLEEAETFGLDSLAVAPNPELVVKTPGVLTACTDLPFLPFEYYDNGLDGRVLGIDGDLLRLVAATNGLRVEFVDVAFDELFTSLGAGTCDVVASAVPKALADASDVRGAVEASDAYAQIGAVSIAKTGSVSDTATTLDALAGSESGVIRGSAEALLTSNASVFSSTSELLAAVVNGSIDRALVSTAAAAAAVEQTEGLRAKPITDAPSQPLVFVALRSNPKLVDALNQGLSATRRNGTYRRVFQRYLGALADGAVIN